MKMTLSLAFSTLLALSPAYAAPPQHIPAEADWDAFIIDMLGVAAYCDVDREHGMSLLYERGYSSIEPDIQVLALTDWAQFVPSVEAAISRLTSAGVIIESPERYTLTDCALTPERIELRVQTANDVLAGFSEEDAVTLLTDAMTAYGCAVDLRDEATFAAFALRRFADEHDFPLPDPLPEENDPLYTPMAESFFYRLDQAGNVMRRAGAFLVEDSVARLNTCTAPESTPEVATTASAIDPASAAAHIAALEESDFRNILAQSLADVGCTVTTETYGLFLRLYAHNGLAYVGVDTSAQQVAAAFRDLALMIQSDYPYALAITTFQSRREFAPARLNEDFIRLFRDFEPVVVSDCTPEGDLSILQRYEF